MQYVRQFALNAEVQALIYLIFVGGKYHLEDLDVDGDNIKIELLG